MLEEFFKVLIFISESNFSFHYGRAAARRAARDSFSWPLFKVTEVTAFERKSVERDC
jgi:hypothetical protein